LVVMMCIATLVIASNRLSDEAQMVLTGVVCGVEIAIPTSLLIFAISRWRNKSHSRTDNDD